MGGGSCFDCGAKACNLGSCAGTTGLGTGSACTAASQCAGANSVFFPTVCRSPVLIDGGQSGYVGGYCQAPCLVPLTAGCPDAGDYCDTVARCFQACTGVGLGQGSCRVGYVCDVEIGSDGGVLAGSAHCTPNCNTNPTYICGSNSTCDSLGYCQ